MIFPHVWRQLQSVLIDCTPTFNVEGNLEKNLRFAGGEFASITLLKAKHRFDSYRLTHRCDFYGIERLRLGIGFTGKIRDAALSVENGGQKSEKANTDFLPPVTSQARWTISSCFEALLDGNALAVVQGRKEDVLLALTTSIPKNLQLRIGYRVLEGRTDYDYGR